MIRHLPLTTFLVAVLLPITWTCAQEQADNAADNKPEAPAEQPAEPQAENQAPAQQDEPADAAALAIEITEVQGLVQVRTAEDQPWQTPEAGMNLNAGAEFRTGPKSQVKFRVGQTQIITLDRLGTVKVIDAIKRAGKIATDLGMKYGRTELEVEAGGVEHESKIHSPNSTLAVRGSGGVLESDAFQDVAYCVDHMAEVLIKTPEGKIIRVQLPEPVLVTDDEPDPNRLQLLADAYNPMHNGSTDAEHLLWAQNPSGKFLYEVLLRTGGQQGEQSTASQIADVAHRLSIPQ